MWLAPSTWCKAPNFDAEAEDRNVTGWIVDKGVITPATPDGDEIVFGEAVDSESEAMKRGGRRGAAQDAMRLYERLAEYFPQSPLAAESAYRAADIRWQIEAADVATRPSAKMQDPLLRAQIDESRMKQVVKKYPGTGGSRSRRLSFHQQQDLRRLAGRGQVSGEGS